MKGLMSVACLVVAAGSWAQEALEAPDWELTLEEQALARKLAEAAPALEGYRAEERLFFVAAELFRDKQSIDRQAQVIHYRYAGDLTLLTRVNLSRREVVGVDPRGHYPTRLSREEFEMGREMVLADPEVRRELGSDLASVVLEPMPIRTYAEGDPLLHHRIFRVLFKLDGDYLRSPIVSVDLTTRQIIFEGRRKQPQRGAGGRPPRAADETPSEVDHE